MGLITLLHQLTRVFFHVLSWPSVTLMCPLYTSIRAIKSDKECCYQHCLKYWVLFAMITFLEWAFAEFTVWVNYWPYAKGLVYPLIALPQSGSASFIYLQFVKPYITPDSCMHCLFLIPEIIDFTFRKHNDCTGAALAHTEGCEEEIWEGLLTCQVESDPTSYQFIKPQKVQKQWNSEISVVNTKCLEKHMKGRKYDWEEELMKKEIIPTNEVVRSAQEYREGVPMRSVICEVGLDHRANLESVQKEWSCALCLVNTSSEKNLQEHVRGRKHRFKENETVSLKDVQTPSEINTENCITALLESLNMIQLRGFFCQIKRPIKLCSWKKPDYGWIKLNTDGSMGPGRAGLGGLLRDHNGAPLCAYVSKALQDDIFMVELWAIWRGLRLALTMGIKFIWVESDSMSAVKTIKREQPSYVPKASGCLGCIWETLERFEKYRVTHAWRESNRVADYLSKMDIVGSDFVLLPVGFPRCLKKMIDDDAQGKWYFRL